MIGLLLSHLATDWRHRSVEAAVDATVAGADAIVAASRREHVTALRSSLSCVVLAGVSAFSGAMARALDGVAAGQPKPGGERVVFEWTPSPRRHRRRAEDMN